MEQLIDMIRELIAQARAHVQTLFARIESLPVIFQPILARLRQLVDQINQKVEEFLDDAAYILAHNAPLAALLLQQVNWLQNVKAPVSSLSGTLKSSSGNENIAFWDGAAKTTYDEKKNEQAAALDEIAVRASFVSDWLATIHASNVSYVSTVARQLTAMVGDLTTVAIDTATLDLPIAIGDLSGIIGNLVEERLNDYIVVGERFVEAAERVRETLSKATKQDSLPYGNWPQAVN